MASQNNARKVTLCTLVGALMSQAPGASAQGPPLFSSELDDLNSNRLQLGISAPAYLEGPRGGGALHLRQLFYGNLEGPVTSISHDLDASLLTSPKGDVAGRQLWIHYAMNLMAKDMIGFSGVAELYVESDELAKSDGIRSEGEWADLVRREYRVGPKLTARLPVATGLTGYGIWNPVNVEWGNPRKGVAWNGGYGGNVEIKLDEITRLRFEGYRHNLTWRDSGVPRTLGSGQVLLPFDHDYYRVSLLVRIGGRWCVAGVGYAENTPWSDRGTFTGTVGFQL